MAAKKITRRGVRRKAASGAPKPKKAPAAPVPAILDDVAPEFERRAEENPDATLDGSLVVDAILSAGREALARGLVEIEAEEYAGDIDMFEKVTSIIRKANLDETTQAAITLALLSAFRVGRGADMLPELAPQRKQQEWNERGAVARAGKKVVADTVRAALYAEIRRLADIFRAENPHARGNKAYTTREIRPAVRAYIAQLEVIPGGWELANESDSQQVDAEIGRISKHTRICRTIRSASSTP